MFIPPVQEGPSNDDILKFLGVPGTIEVTVLITAFIMNGHKDKSGEPLLFHCLRVGMAGANEKERVLGFLHDCWEDNQERLEELGLDKFFLGVHGDVRR